MYLPTPTPGASRWRRPSFANWRGMGPNVWALGITSLVTDISSEMVTSVLPLYVVIHLQMTPMAFGALDGLYQGVAALVRMGSGVLADRFRRHKAAAAFGYALSAVAKLGYLAAGRSWPAFLGVISVDRLGKGIRTAPRDALVAASAPDGRVATAFGIHRTMDAAGSALGPLAAFALLWLAPGRFDQVFIASFAAGLVGVAAILLLVDVPTPQSAEPGQAAHEWARTLSALTAPGFRTVLVAAVVVSLATVSDGLLYLVLQRQQAFDPTRIPLLFVGTPVCYFLLAGPCGIAADRHGPRWMFVGGHAALLLMYGVLWLGWTSPIAVGGSLLLLGAYYAATDGILAAMASLVLPADVRATGLGLLATGTTAARGMAALAFGALWTYRGSDMALTAFGLVLLIAMGVAAFMLGIVGSGEPRGPRGAPGPDGVSA